MPYAPSSAPLAEPDLSQFSFWLGSWVVIHTDDDGREWEGANVVSLVEGGAAVEERFSLVQPDGELMTGRSYSVPVPGRGWCQTWVDSSGSYLDFVGGWTGSEMVLSRTGERAGAPVEQRMIFYAIEPASLSWDWQSRAGGGGPDAPWTLDWRLAYRRAS
jgi:hypothetical protein